MGTLSSAKSMTSLGKLRSKRAAVARGRVRIQPPLSALMELAGSRQHRRRPYSERFLAILVAEDPTTAETSVVSALHHLASQASGASVARWAASPQTVCRPATMLGIAVDHPMPSLQELVFL